MAGSTRRVVVVDTEADNMVALDFGEDSTVEVVDGRVIVTTTAEKAMSFLSDQTVRDAIRHKINKSHRGHVKHRSGVVVPAH